MNACITLLTPKFRRFANRGHPIIAQQSARIPSLHVFTITARPALWYARVHQISAFKSIEQKKLYYGRKPQLNDHLGKRTVRKSPCTE